MRKKILVLFSLFGLGFLPASFAGTCYLSASNIIFGRYTRTGASPLTSVGTFYVACTDNASYTYCVRLNTGASRVMTRIGGTTTLNYQLYRDAALTNVWTNNSCVTVTKSCPFNNPCQETLYGRVPNGQAVSTSGTYQGTITASLNINATAVVSYAQAYITDGCNVNAGLFNFGIYDPYSNTNLDVARTNLHVNCNTGRSYTVSLSAGNSGNVNTRYMVNGSGHLLYNFYTNSSRTTVWGANSVSGTGNGSTQDLTIYGRIPAHQYLATGGYLDTITVVVNF